MSAALVLAASGALATTAVPPNTGDGYVAAAYIVFFALLLIYVAIMAVRLTRVERGLRELRAREQEGEPLEEEPRARSAVQEREPV